MIDLTQLKRKAKTYEYIGTRIDTETKDALAEVCQAEDITISALIQALVRDFLNTKGGAP